MSKLSWLVELQPTLANLPPTSRIALLGIGHELNGDDAAGLVVARGFGPLAAGQDRLLVIEAGPAPENHTGALRAFRPDLVLLVDAAQMGAEPGAVRCVDWRDTTGISASTHTLPLHMLAQFITAEFNAAVLLIGIQPQQNNLDVPLSPPVQAAAAGVVRELALLLIG